MEDKKPPNKIPSAQHRADATEKNKRSGERPGHRKLDSVERTNEVAGIVKLVERWLSTHEALSSILKMA